MISSQAITAHAMDVTEHVLPLVSSLPTCCYQPAGRRCQTGQCAPLMPPCQQCLLKHCSAAWHTSR
jgi:hypothetical protein